MSNVRVEIGGGSIKNYCNSDSLSEMVKEIINFELSKTKRKL